jgi:putative PIN family toxin of toxin-antitoxin system
VSDEPFRWAFDTNVLVSAALDRGSLPAIALRQAQRNGVLLLSRETESELADVIARPKFDRYLNDSLRTEFFSILRHGAERVEITDRIQACRDPKDDKFLEVAVNGRADCLVSGDEDLLTLHPFRGVAIITPASFVERVRERRPNPS